MKKYICLALTIALAIFATKFDWYLSGNEAVAATKQVLNGDDYLMGRTTQEMWGTINGFVGLASGFLAAVTAYLFASEHINKNETEN